MQSFLVHLSKLSFIDEAKSMITYGLSFSSSKLNLASIWAYYVYQPLSTPSDLTISTLYQINTIYIIIIFVKEDVVIWRYCSSTCSSYGYSLGPSRKHCHIPCPILLSEISIFCSCTLWSRRLHLYPCHNHTYASLYRSSTA